MKEKMEFVLRAVQGGAERTVTAKGGESLLSALRSAGLGGLRADCGGNGTCGRCAVRVTGELRHLSDGAAHSARGGEFLACRWAAAGELRVVLPDEGEINVLTRGAAKIPPSGEGLGAAVDIGTTTVALFLYELPSGELLAVESGRNAQRPFGADVLSRIVFASGQDGLLRLTRIIRGQLDAMLDAACKKAGRARAEITELSIAGNTVMQHIFAGLSPETIGVAPFTPLSLFGSEEAAERYFDGLCPGARLYLAPALAGYVGGDITAGLYGSGALESRETTLFLDIGTNGEMALGDKNGYICCATAAGPAFEGAEIECGMDGSAGAVSRVRYEGGGLELEVIGGGQAKGICGSGLIDAIAAMLRCGAILESGRMCTPGEAPENVRERLKPAQDGKMRFYLARDVFVSALDVRQIQLAKAAIRAGAETLMELAGKGAGDIARVLLAGGFGAYINVDSACAIGLLPPALREKTLGAGNTAGRGAALALSRECRRELGGVCALCSYHELSSSRIFMDKYIGHMAFDETETEL